MKKVVLNKKERYFLEGKFYIVTSGSLCAYDIFENGKYIPREACFKAGEIVGNFFEIFPNKNLVLPEMEVEIMAMEDNTIIEEFNLIFLLTSFIYFSSFKSVYTL